VVVGTGIAGVDRGKFWAISNTGLRLEYYEQKEK